MPARRPDPVDAAPEVPKPRRRKGKRKKPGRLAAILGGCMSLVVVLVIVAVPVAKLVKIAVIQNRIDEREEQKAEADRQPDERRKQPADGLRITDPAAPPELTAGLYGDIPGEATIPPAEADFLTALRPRAGDPIYELSNARIEAGPNGRPVLRIDVRQRRPCADRVYPAMFVHLSGQGRKVWSYGPPSPHGSTGRALPHGRSAADVALDGTTGLECYLGHYRRNNSTIVPLFKLSNSATIGPAADIHRARDWTTAEAERLKAGPRAKPVPPPTASAPADSAGQSPRPRVMKMLGSPNKSVPVELSIVGNGRLLAVDRPDRTFSRDEPIPPPKAVFDLSFPTPTGYKRETPPGGYAINKMLVHVHRVTGRPVGIQFGFVKVRPDGTRDLDDTKRGVIFGNPSPARRSGKRRPVPCRYSGWL